MRPAPEPWPIALARVEGALPFLTPEQGEILAQRSLRALWATHVRDYPFENHGIYYESSLHAAELMRTDHATERHQFLSWIVRRGPPPLAQAAQTALDALGLEMGYSTAYADADRALERLDALLPAADPVATLTVLADQLIHDEAAFLEGGTEAVLVLGRAVDRPAGAGAAWAASLAVAMRPHLFGLGAAPLAFAGLLPREIFRPLRERQPGPILAEAVSGAVESIRRAVDAARMAQERDKGLADICNRSSRAPQVWRLLIGLGPLTRAETARSLHVTKKTASAAATALETAGLARSQGRYGPLIIHDEWPV